MLQRYLPDLVQIIRQKMIVLYIVLAKHGKREVMMLSSTTGTTETRRDEKKDDIVTTRCTHKISQLQSPDGAKRSQEQRSAPYPFDLVVQQQQSLLHFYYLPDPTRLHRFIFSTTTSPATTPKQHSGRRSPRPLVGYLHGRNTVPR